MECKIFYGSNREEIQNKVNAWLKEHPVTPDSMRFQFSTVSIEDTDSYRLEHTLVVFYVPMHPIGR